MKRVKRGDKKAMRRWWCLCKEKKREKKKQKKKRRSGHKMLENMYANAGLRLCVRLTEVANMCFAFEGMPWDMNMSEGKEWRMNACQEEEEKQCEYVGNIREEKR